MLFTHQDFTSGATDYYFCGHWQ